MIVTIELDNIYDLLENCWGQARQILNEIKDADKDDDLIQHLEDIFGDQTPSLTELNDYLAYDWEYIYDAIGMSTDDND